MLGLVVILALVGALGGWAVSLLRWETRPATVAGSAGYLEEARRALFVSVRTYGSLPFADTNGDGQPDAGSLSGTLPYAALGLPPADLFGKSIGYQVNPAVVNPLNPAEGLTSTQSTDALRKRETCRALKVARDPATVAVTLTMEKTVSNLTVGEPSWSAVIKTGSSEDATAASPPHAWDQETPDPRWDLYGWLTWVGPTGPKLMWKACAW